MVDLHGRRGIRAAHEDDGRSGVRVVQDAALGKARAGPHLQIDQVATQDVVAGVAAVVTELHVDVVTPGLAEPGAAEVLEAVPALDGQRLEVPPGRVERRVGGKLLRDGFPAWGVAAVEPTDTGGDRDDDQQRQRVPIPAAPSGNDTRHIAVLALETVEC